MTSTAIKNLLSADNTVTLIILSADDLRASMEEISSMTAIKVAKSLIDTKESPDDLLDTKQTALLIGISTQTLWRWNRSGKLRPVITSPHPRYRRSDIRAIINPPTTPAP